MRRINLRSINVRFNTITTVLVLALLAGFGTYNYKATESALNEQLEREIQSVLTRLSLSVPSTLWNFETDQLNSIVESEVSGTSVAGIFVYDDKGKLVLGRWSESGQESEARDAPPADAPLSEEAPLVYVEGDSETPVGRLVVVGDETNIRAVQSASLRRVVVQNLVLVALLAVAVGLLLRQMVIRPIDRISAALNDIAEGEGDLTRRLDDHSNDEIGDVAQAFNRFVEKIQNLVHKVVESVDQIGTGTLSMQELAARTTSGVDNQRAETNQVATAMNEMTSTAADVAESANNAAQAAQQAEEQGQRARTIVQAATDAVRILAEEIEAGTAVINELEKSVADITSMVDVITAIAEQTNLLALNAAIEAARAGEQGRGFAVVADEVRSLASRTQKSTEEIQDMIDKLQDRAHQAVEVMRRGRERGDQTVERASEADDALNQVSEAITTINDMNVQIASAAEEQTAVTDEINQSLTRIVEVAEQAAQDTAETERASERLNGLSEELRALVSHFQV